jgi:hypothetical protein
VKQLRKLLSLHVAVPIFLYVVVPVLVVAAAGCVNWDNDIPPLVTEEMAQDGETTTSNPMDPAIPVLQSDLEITRLEVSNDGRRPVIGHTFPILVQVTNQGQAASGDYTIEIWQEIVLITLDQEWCGVCEGSLMDSYTMGRLAPGETHIIEKEDMLLDCPAWYTIFAEITPIGWQESNNSRHVESLNIFIP